MCIKESLKLVAHGRELGDLVADLGESVAKQRVGVPARALAAIDDVQEFVDVLETEPDAFGATNEPQPIHERWVVEPVPAVAAWSGRKQPDALVVADSVRRDVCLAGELGHCEAAHHRTP